MANLKKKKPRMAACVEIGEAAYLSSQHEPDWLYQARTTTLEEDGLYAAQMLPPFVKAAPPASHRSTVRPFHPPLIVEMAVFPVI